MSVVMLAGRGASTWMVANAIQSAVGLQAVILESPPSRWQAIRRRAGRLGWAATAGQLLFSLYAGRLRAQSAARSAEILRANELRPERPPGLPVFRAMA